MCVCVCACMRMCECSSFIFTQLQMQQAPNENFDLTGRKQVWKCESNRCATTIKEYSEYQKKVELGEVC